MSLLSVDAAETSGQGQAVTSAILDTHFHTVLEITHDAEVSEDEIARRVRDRYGGLDKLPIPPRFKTEGKHFNYRRLQNKQHKVSMSEKKQAVCILLCLAKNAETRVDYHFQSVICSVQ